MTASLSGPEKMARCATEPLSPAATAPQLAARELMPLVSAALKRGQRVRMTVSGSSMMPFLRNDEVVEIKPTPMPRLGDMVLVQQNERYVLHRIVRMNSPVFFIRGDAQSWTEGPFSAEHVVLGRVTVAWRKGRRRNFERGFWRLAGLLWLRTNPLGFFLLQGVLQYNKLTIARTTYFESSYLSVQAKREISRQVRRGDSSRCSE